WFVEPPNNFSTSYRQALAGSDVERNTFPAPGIDLQPQCDKCFRSGILCHAFFITVATELPTHEIGWLDRRNRFEHFYFFISERFAVVASGRFHREVGNYLEEMVLDHIAHRAGLIVEAAAALNSKIFGQDRKSTRLNSSHVAISYAVFCLKKKIGLRYCSSVLSLKAWSVVL